MHSTIMFTTDCNSRTIDFCKSINIIKLNAKFICNSFSHLVSPAFRTNYSFFKFNLISNTSLGNFFRK